MKRLILMLVVLGLIVPAKSYCQEEEREQLSPYFHVQSDDPTVDPFPLLETKVKVNIAGVIADVELTQVYKNEGKRTIEAVYIFPLGTKSAIHKMKMKIGERIINAKIEERQAAQKIYDQAKKQGKIASLLEQQRPNVFQMKVANIMAGDKVEVTVGYSELLIPEEGIYEFVYPTVVGPRYGGEVTEPKENDQWVKSPYLHQGDEPSSDFDIEVALNAAMPLSKVVVPTHRVKVEKEADKAQISLAEEEKKGANRDFILRYSLEGKTIQTGLLLYPGVEENFFLLMAQPPQRVSRDEVPPREYIFIVDVSGSMYGYPLDVSKTLIKKLLAGLGQKDYFNILFFSGGSNVLSEYPLPATEENINKAIAMLKHQRGSGGTNILSALKRVFSLPKKEGFSRTIIAATDGYVAVEKETFDLIRENLDQANFFAFGIGTSVNRYLIEGMARAGNGEPFVVTNQKEADKLAEKFLGYVQTPLLTDIKVSYEEFDVYEVEPVSLPDLFTQKPLIIYGKYHKAKGTIRICGKGAHDTYNRDIRVDKSLESNVNIALKYLWAREKIARLADYAKVGVAIKDEVTQLGLKYSLMTDYTSFVAVDTIIRDTGEIVTVKQPLPLPQGVSDYAVGGVEKIYSANSSSSLYRSLEIGGGYSFHSLGRAEDKSAPVREIRKAPLKITIIGKKLPKDITQDDLEKILTSIRKELAELFKSWELKQAYLILEIKKGQVKKIQVKSHEGKDYDQEILEKTFQKINFKASLSAQIELELIA